MSALLRQTPFRTKIDEKIDVFVGPRFWRPFGTILGGFGYGFGRPKPSIFDAFWILFRRQILEDVLEGKKSRKIAKNQFCSTFWARPGGMCGARGRDREGVTGAPGQEI